MSENKTNECAKCAELEDACPACARAIHEAWHEKGLFWIRPEECHENCPGRLKDKQDDPMESASEWLCNCGERANPASPQWRWNGRDWEHHHGYPIGHCAAVRNPANTKARPFEGDLAVIERLLRERGFRLSRGTWAGPEGERLPTVCIDRPDTPEWNGVWSVWDDEHGEVQTAFVLSGVAMETWHRRDVSNAGGEAA